MARGLRNTCSHSAEDEVSSHHEATFPPQAQPTCSANCSSTIYFNSSTCSNAPTTNWCRFRALANSNSNSTSSSVACSKSSSTSSNYGSNLSSSSTNYRAYSWRTSPQYTRNADMLKIKCQFWQLKIKCRYALPARRPTNLAQEPTVFITRAKVEALVWHEKERVFQQSIA